MQMISANRAGCFELMAVDSQVINLNETATMASVLEHLGTFGVEVIAKAKASYVAPETQNTRGRCCVKKS